VYQMTQAPNRLTTTGGNFMTDGFGKGYSSKLVLDENSSLTKIRLILSNIATWALAHTSK
ncbi:MAG: hypothetical protein PHD06_13190, partial [Bacteroidales bacterium]|nr:hypothetical protein [Bacteroidales bacterium]